jgi:uridine phosphorylase
MSEKEIYHLKIDNNEIGSYIFLSGDPERVKSISEKFELSHKVHDSRGFIIYTGYLDGTKVSAVNSGIGCPSTALVIEELIMLGAHTFLRVGTCGALQSNIANGDLIISTASIRDEGTSRQYVPVEFPAVANIDLVLELIQSAKVSESTYHVGITHCKDAFYSELSSYTAHNLETSNRWTTWQRSNALGTEMEASIIFILSSLRKCRAGTILTVVGSTVDGGLIADGTSVQRSVDIAVKAMTSLIKKDTEA